jgi:secondary thiamine-phosphate synthase enzyme
MVLHIDWTVETRGRGFTELTAGLEQRVAGAGLRSGLCTVLLAHTSASLILCENADPTVRQDLETWFSRQIPDGDPHFRHRDEGPDDMSAHLRSILTSNSIGVPVRDGRLVLGTWQGLFLWEHRTRPHQRRLVLTLLGDG